MILKELSGHMYYGSSHETSSSCGNCDGARCDTCSIVYSVFVNDEQVGWSKDAIRAVQIEADAIEKASKK